MIKMRRCRMNKIWIAALIAGCVSVSLNGANYDIGISGSDRGVSGFSLSIGDYYHAPSQEIVVIERFVPREEMSVVYFLARKANRDPRYIADLRHRGNSWWDISVRLGLDPYTLYTVDTRRHAGPPYGKAYGYYKEGKHHRLRDTEIVELVNVRFLSSYHGVHVDEVIDRRHRGERYMNIDDAYRGKKFNQREYQDRRENRYQERDNRGDMQRVNQREKGQEGNRGREK